MKSVPGFICSVDRVLRQFDGDTHFHNSEAYRNADDPPIARNSSVNSGVTTSIIKANRYLIEVGAFSQAHR
ncbi:hypothetical protein MIH18_10650 [Marinobacter sp. M3C]|uniref:hypothetical protein n=1 Tax=unclassified Marinobacter TaxID=83889 RepID=UPI00200C9435|nr:MULTISPECIES: hypothetical protein [unclassified Marinobacter]MCL1477171.1 hypothetical protein [Marinobacter sp.]MCL1484867.1 hypothetical protein [Marinobacter sp.]UQG56476.1 hypothetical protein MIH16_01995 [Marinobacter sp. M4C]UQG62330.1 hypothetical protein MIH18_10650 [Marinobacter sp. M3C]UQG65280.1 hypothetical protein MIH17_01995 [Marinobacter sp. M2C]